MRVKAIKNEKLVINKTPIRLEVNPSDTKTIERFTKKIRNYGNLTEDECWIWDGSLTMSGALGTRWYGGFSYQGKPAYAHRMSYAIFKGPLLLGAQVNHSCNNPLCVNPNHLHLGTARTNMDECLEQNRFPNCEYHPKARLTNDQVREILSLKGIMPQNQIAEKFEVSQTTISAIMNGKMWTKLGTYLQYDQAKVITVGDEN